jgi:hypothetical protein
VDERPAYVPSDLSEEAVAFMRRCSVIREDGTFNAEQACKELADFHVIIGECSKVYYHVTGGMLSKPLSASEHVIRFADEREERETAEAVADETEDIREELEAEKECSTKLRDVLARVQKHRYHYPDSDGLEYCAGCGRCPYWEPPHLDDCLVVAIDRVLKEVAGG